MKPIYLSTFLFLLFQNVSFSQPDTLTNRYADSTDAAHWPTVNEGDFIFFTGNNNNGESIYANGSVFDISLPLGNKILIWHGEYRRILINGANCASTSAQPTIITNLGGQVKWGYSTAQNHYRSLELYNFDYIYLTGKYDQIAQTGDPNFLGHNKGNNYNQPNFHEKYGMWGNPRWSGYRNNGTFSNIVRIRHFTTCKIDYVAATEGGFAGFNIKTDSPANPSEIEIDIQDCFTALTEGEGFYISWSTGAINKDITKLTLRNNIMAFNGAESMQTDNLVEGSLIEHNVAFAGACFHRRPFQDANQDGLHQFSFCEGGVTVQNNAMINGNSMHKLRFRDPGPGRVTPDTTKAVLMKNNYYGFGRSNISFVWEGDSITPYVIDGNIYGPISVPSSRDAYNTPPSWGAFYKVCNANTPITLKNITYPPGKPLVNGSCGVSMIDTIQNVQAVAPIVDFVNSGFSDTIDYRNITFWSAEYGTTDKAGIFIPYNVGDIVFFDDSTGSTTHFYECIQAHAANYPPSNFPAYWQQIDWNGSRLPPFDLRMAQGSYYHNKNIGLLYEILISPGVEETQVNEKELSIYPNPTKDVFFIQSEKEMESVTFLDITGKKTYSIKNYVSNSSIKNSDFKNGIYFVKVRFVDGEIKTKKLIISKP